MKKRILSAVVAFCLVFGSAASLPRGVFISSTSISVSAEALVSGDFEYTLLADDTVEITKYKGSGGAVLIPSAIGGKIVTRIGERAFCDCSDITAVTIPESVAAIGDDAFSGCTGLKSITIKNGAKTIGVSAFFGCSALKKITLPKSVESIGGYAFGYCEELESITVPSSVKSIGGCVFDGTKWLENKQKDDPLVIVNGILIDAKKTTGKVTVPGSVNHINESAFDFNSNVTDVIIPRSVTGIGELAFNGCRALENITIPNTVGQIGGYAFYGTKWLENKQSKDPLVVVNGMLVDGAKCTGNVTVPSNVTRVNDYAFETGKTITGVEIPSSVTSIGKKAFSDCPELAAVNFTGNVKSIGADAFSYCPKLTSVNIPKGVESIGYNAFSCTGLKTVTIPKTVKQIDEQAFGYYLNVNHMDIVPGYLLRVYKDSSAEKYARDNGIAYEIIQETVTRLAGKGRYETAVEISKAAYDKADTVVLAYSLNYADALAGVPLAYQKNAPILLTNTGKLDDATLAEIKRLGAKNVIILGGEGVISKDVETALEKEKITSQRIAGKSRFGTAAAIAENLNENPTDVFFVYGLNYADALSVSTAAAVKNSPIIYLTTDGRLNPDTAQYLAKLKKNKCVKNAYVIGGEGVISNDMMSKAASALGLSKATRVAGKDRFSTCVAVNEQFKNVLNGDMLCIATGMDFPDALAGGVYAAKNKAPLFLINGKAKTPNLNDEQKAFLKANAAGSFTAFGGTGVVPDEHIKDIVAASV